MLVTDCDAKSCMQYQAGRAHRDPMQPWARPGGGQSHTGLASMLGLNNRRFISAHRRGAIGKWSDYIELLYDTALFGCLFHCGDWNAP